MLKHIGFLLVQLVIFSGKSKPGNSMDVGSGHPELAPLACDLYCSKGLEACHLAGITPAAMATERQAGQSWYGVWNL